MVSIKEATERAMEFARDVLGRKRTTGVRLEEVESTSLDGEDAWLITLSMPIPDNDLSGLAASINDAFGTRNRQYKSFMVLKRDGEVKSMKNRKLAGV
jgi:hypothetical protein